MTLVGSLKMFIPFDPVSQPWEMYKKEIIQTEHHTFDQMYLRNHYPSG